MLLSFLVPLSVASSGWAQPTPPRVVENGKIYPYDAEYKKYQKAIEEGPYIPIGERALPSQKNLPDFELRVEKGDHCSTLYAKRKSDLADLEVLVISSSNPDAIEGFLFNEKMNSMLWLPRFMGTPSGKPLGEKVWRSRPPKDKNAKSTAFTLHVQDGPSLVRIQLLSHIDTGEHGQAVPRALREDDPAFVEQLARGIVWRLHTLGLAHDTFKQP